MVHFLEDCCTTGRDLNFENDDKIFQIAISEFENLREIIDGELRNLLFSKMPNFLQKFYVFWKSVIFFKISYFLESPIYFGNSEFEKNIVS